MDRRPFDLVIAAATDGNYAWPAVLALLSAASHSNGRTLCMLGGDGLDDDFVTAARSAFARLSVPFEYVAGDFSAYDALPLARNLTRAAYGRLRLPEAASAYAPLTLYLDADTLAIRDLALPPKVDLDETRFVAAVRAHWIPTCSSPGGITGWEARGIDPGAPFFSSGVLLIDNDHWLEHDVERQVVDESALYATPRGGDQSPLNAILYGRWSELPRAWNHELVPKGTVRVGPVVVTRGGAFSLRDTRILHFITATKPWDRRYPPGSVRSLYRRAWERLLPVPPPPVDGLRTWIRKRHVT